MGCFSFLCSKCDKPIRSDSSSGQHCVLFLMENGEVIEWMQGEYDSYGRVFKQDTYKENLRDDCSQLWTTRSWDSVCDLMSIGSGSMENGIAAYHSKCWDDEKATFPIPSDHDPEQGDGPYYRRTTFDFSHGFSFPRKAKENKKEQKLVVDRRAAVLATKAKRKS